MTTRLLTIPFSHYCEKARWALDRVGAPYAEERHLPLFHYLPARRAGGSRTVPVLVDGGTAIADSTDIIAWADARAPGALLPADPVERAAALQLEEDFDAQLGPATRRWMYFHSLSRRDLESLLVRDVPRWQRIALAAARPLAMTVLRRTLKLDAAGAARSQAKIEAGLARVSELVADGRRYLVGNRFSVADLTFAALAAPVLMPAEYGVRLPAPSDFDGEPRARIEAWRALPAGRFALRLYAEDRAAGRHN